MRIIDRRQQLLTTRLTLRLQAPYTHSGSFSSAFRSKCVRAAILSQFLRFAGLCCVLQLALDGLALAVSISALRYRTMIADCPTKVSNEYNVYPKTYCRGPTAVNCVLHVLPALTLTKTRLFPFTVACYSSSMDLRCAGHQTHN